MDRPRFKSLGVNGHVSNWTFWQKVSAKFREIQDVHGYSDVGENDLMVPS